MKAARYYGEADIRVEDVDEPRPGPGQILVDVEWCGICGSDLHEYTHGPVGLPTPDKPHPISGVHIPLTLGHELCGIVRNPPSATSKFKEGDAVMVDPRILCEACLACKTGLSECCTNLGYVGANTGFGGYGEKVVVDENKLYLLPPEIPLEYAAVLEPLAVVHHAIKISGIKEWTGVPVLVLGGGPIGFALLLCLRAAGADNVIVSEPASARRHQVSEFSRAVINPIEEDVNAKCRELTDGHGIEVAFDCAGVRPALISGLDALKFHGLYVMLALWAGNFEVPAWRFLSKHITIKGSLIFDDAAMGDVIELIVKGKLIGFEKMVTARIGLDDIVSKGFEELVHNKDTHIKILVRPK